MRIATQNLNWGGEPTAPGCDGEPRLERLISYLESLNAELLVLTEFKSGALEDELKERLADAGYPHLISHPQGPRQLGAAIASRKAVKVALLPISAVEPWRSIGVSIEGIDVFAFYFPLNKPKELYWDWILANAEKLVDRDVVLLGDFNTGKVLIDEAGVTFDCQDKHESMEKLGFVDTWRAAYPKGRDYTWYSSAGNGFRLDYIWSSKPLAHRFVRVWHDHHARLTLSSDHSTVVADLAMPEGVSHG